MARLHHWGLLLALTLVPGRTAALTVEPTPWGQLTYTRGPICRIESFPDSNPTGIDHLFVTVSWDDGFELYDWARIPSDIWRASANIRGNAAMMRQVCGAVIASYRRNLPAAAAGKRRPIHGVRPLPSREVRVADIIMLGPIGCNVNFPSGSAPSVSTTVMVGLMFEGDAGYKGVTSLPLDWSTVPDEPARLTLAKQICSDIQADLGLRLRELP